MGNRELPVEFGNWNSVFKRFRRWVKADVFHYMFKEIASNADLEYAMIDRTIVKVHRSGQGAKALSSLQAATAGQLFQVRTGTAQFIRQEGGVLVAEKRR